MTESLHKIVMHYLFHSEADDLCQDITGWLKRNYQHYGEEFYGSIQFLRQVLRSLA